MGPYAAAGPDRAIVLPSRIELEVIPTSVCTVGLLEPPQAAAVTKRAATAASLDPVFRIETPSAFIETYLNSLGPWRHLSSLSFGDPPQASAQAGISADDKADHPVRGEDHRQDQHHPVRDGGAGLLDGRGDLRRDPGLGRHPLVRLDG